MEEISTADAPDAIGPYSQAIRHGNTVYTAGQGPLDPETGAVVDGDIGAQTARTMENLAAVLSAADTSLENVVKATVYLGDMADYATVNEVYEEYVSAPFPARTAVEVGEFPVELGVEIEVVAAVE